MPLRRTGLKSIALIGLALALAALPACGEDEQEPPLPRACGVDLPPPGYDQDDYITTKEPASPPYDSVTYRWTCLDGWLVDETWKRDGDGCWVRDGEYRRENPNCPRTP
jgi:hypothetical protein